ncbi:MAG: alanine:cation symporter family protein [Flavobacteriaceae bacterium]|nr:alanine:cation symporter family protein [Flavobacteriaceae bacterium]
MEEIIKSVNDIVWSNALIFVALASGLFYSFKTRFVQIRMVKEMVRLLFGGKSSERGVSSFQAFAIAISGRVGTGNIAGVATAIALGGPGAIFWMWVIAFLGSASAFIEATLGQLYKENKDGEYRGGPAYYIEKGLGIKWFATLFAIATILSTALFLPGVQANSIAAGVNSAFGIDVTYTGIAIIVFLAIIVFGGVKRIGKFSEIVVPFMAIAYILLAVIIIGMNFREIPEILKLIISSAFGANQAFGGIVGMAIMWGVKRGVYSNEAGQGTAPHAAAAAEVSHPAKQGLVQAFSVYIDTLFICTATAFMILFTLQYNVIDPSGGFISENIPGVVYGPEYTQLAIESQFPGFGKIFVAIALSFFAFTTIMAYYYIAETNVSYLDHKNKNKWMIWVLRILLLTATFYGSIKSAELAWTMGDIGVGIMAWLNFIAIFLLRKPALALLKDYEKQKKEGKDPVYDPDESNLGIKNVEIWRRIAKRNKEKKIE